MSSSENHSTPVRAKNNATGALRTWRHLTVGGHVACVLVVAFGYLVGYCAGHNQAAAAAMAFVYVIYAVWMAQKLTNITE